MCTNTEPEWSASRGTQGATPAGWGVLGMGAGRRRCHAWGTRPKGGVSSCNRREASLTVRHSQWSFCPSRLPDKRGYTEDGLRTGRCPRRRLQHQVGMSPEPLAWAGTGALSTPRTEMPKQPLPFTLMWHQLRIPAAQAMPLRPTLTTSDVPSVLRAPTLTNTETEGGFSLPVPPSAHPLPVRQTRVAVLV